MNLKIERFVNEPNAFSVIINGKRNLITKEKQPEFYLACKFGIEEAEMHADRKITEELVDMLTR